MLRWPRRSGRETDVRDTFLDSSWYFVRVQRHHLYARFVTLALHDLRFARFEEPFPPVRLGGLIVKEGAKTSKSRGNVVVPDDYIDQHGSDVLRCAVMTP